MGKLLGKETWMEKKAEVRCKACGWEGQWVEVGSKTVYEDYGDVSCSVCPSCHRVEYDGFEMFEDIVEDTH